MAMAARLQMVTDKEIDALVKEPTSINKVEKKDYFASYFYLSINYFLCGDAWPSASRKKPLTAMFFGYETIDTPTLENGNFGVIRAVDVKRIADALSKVDLEKLKKQVEDVDPDELAAADADDFEFLVTDDANPAKTIADDVTSLKTFYLKAAKLGRGVVMYSS